MIRVLVVDDHDIVRDALASLLGDVADLQVVGVASSIRDALPLLDSARPDIVLADLSLGDGSAVELVRALRRGRLKGRVIVITGFSDEFAAAEALTAGATGYVLKSQPTSELLEAIRTVFDAIHAADPDPGLVEGSSRAAVFGRTLGVLAVLLLASAWIAGKAGFNCGAAG